jgi:hypothetical protein
MADEPIHMTEEDRHRVTMQVDHFIEILSARYGIKPADVVETVNWVKDRKEFFTRVKMSGAVSIIGLVIGALLLSMWEGIKLAITHGGKP